MQSNFAKILGVNPTAVKAKKSVYAGLDQPKPKQGYAHILKADEGKTDAFINWDSAHAMRNRGCFFKL